MAMVRLTAPEGYKLLDKKTRQMHSEILTDENQRGRYELVPDTTEPTIDEEYRG